MAEERSNVSDKQAVVEVLSRLPDDASLEDIQYEFETIHGILVSMRNADAGHTRSQAEVVAEVRQWLQKSAGQMMLASS